MNSETEKRLKKQSAKVAAMYRRKKTEELSKLTISVIVGCLKEKKYKAAWMSFKLYVWFKLRCPKTRYLP